MVGTYYMFLGRVVCIVKQVVLLTFGYDFPSMKYLQMHIIKLHIEKERTKTRLFYNSTITRRTSEL